MDTTPLEWIDRDLWDAAWARAIAQQSQPRYAWPIAERLAIAAQEDRHRRRTLAVLERYMDFLISEVPAASRVPTIEGPPVSESRRGRRG